MFSSFDVDSETINGEVLHEIERESERGKDAKVQRLWCDVSSMMREAGGMGRAIRFLRAKQLLSRAVQL